MTYTTEETTPILGRTEDPSHKVGQPLRGAAWKSLLVFAVVLAAACYAVGYSSSSVVPAVASVSPVDQGICDRIPCGCPNTCRPDCGDDDDECPWFPWDNGTWEVEHFGICDRIPCGCPNTCRPDCGDDDECPYGWPDDISSLSLCNRIPCGCPNTCRPNCGDEDECPDDD